MNYKQLKETLFLTEKRLKYFDYFGIASVLIILMLVLWDTNDKFPISIFIAALFIYICATFYYENKIKKPIPCSNCDMDSRISILQLGKDAETAYCPKCGNEIV